MIKTFKTYIVHYKLLVNRKENLEKELKKLALNYEFVSLYDRNNLDSKVLNKFKELEGVHIANFISHIEIYKRLINSGDSFCLVLEDDSVPNKKFKKNINNYLDKLPDNFDLFYVSQGKGNFHIPILNRRPLKNIYFKENEETSWGGHGATRFADGYFVSKKCAKKLIEEFESNNKISKTIDWWKNQIIEKYKLNVYWAEPTIIDTDLYESSLPYN